MAIITPNYFMDSGTIVETKSVRNFRIIPSNTATGNDKEYSSELLILKGSAWNWSGSVPAYPYISMKAGVISSPSSESAYLTFGETGTDFLAYTKFNTSIYFTNVAATDANNTMGFALISTSDFSSDRTGCKLLSLGDNYAAGSYDEKVHFDNNGGLYIDQTSGSGTAEPYLQKLIGAAHTNLSLSAEQPDLYYNLGRTVQFAEGALTTQRACMVLAPTYSFTGASTLTNAATWYIEKAPVAGANATILNKYAFWINNDSARFDGRILSAKGDDVASDFNMVLGDANYFDITGANQILGIAIAGWTAGSEVTLQFDANPDVAHNGVVSGTAAAFQLASSGTFSASAGDTLTLIYDGTYWRETGRAVI